MTAVAVTESGRGPRILLVHGGASPATTWRGLEPLREKWTLASVHRRGYPPSPPVDQRQDFAIDADDIESLLGERLHIVAHSYGVLGTLIAAARRPDHVRSLTLIEPPIYHLLPDDPDVAHLQRLGDAVLTHGLATEPGALREFLRIAGAPEVSDGPLPEEVARGVRRAHGGRLPGEARLDLERLRAAGVPVLVASGNHSVAIERICDALAMALGGERAVVPGAGHMVAAAPGFAGRLERFLRSSG